MVQKAVGGVGILLLTVGIALTVVISIIKEWVNVEIPGVPACTDSPLGKLGLYGAVFDPECTQGEATNAGQIAVKAKFASFAKEEGGTLEFWPLFPSQTSFGPTFANAGIPEFTTCKDFWAESGANSGYAAFRDNVVGNQVEANFALVEAGLKESYTEFTTTIDGAVVLLNNIVAGQWKGATVQTLQKMIQGIQGFLLGKPAALNIQNFLGFINQAAGGSGTHQFQVIIPGQTTSLNSPLVSIDLGAGTPDAAQLTNILDLLNTIRKDGLPEFDATTTYTNAILGLDADATAAASSGALTAADVGAVQLLAGSNAVLCGNADFELATFDACVFNGINGVNATNPVEAAVFEFKTHASAYAGLAQLNDALQVPVQAVIQPCVAAGFNTSLACAPLYTALPQALNETFPLCTLGRAAVGVTDPVKLFPECTPVALISDLASSGSAAIPKEIAPLVPTFAGILAECSSKGATFDQCIASVKGTEEYYTTIKEATLPFPALCLGARLTDALKTNTSKCETFGDFVENVAALAAFQPSYAICVGAQQSSRAGCKALLAGLATPGAVVSFIDGSTPAERVKECEDDEKDASAISTAQILIPVAIAAEGVALLLAIASIPTNKGVLAIVAGVLAIIGTVCTLVGLLLVINAPVYAAVGEKCADFDSCYVSGSAKTMAYVAIAGPLFGGISLIVSSCFNKAVDEDALTSKVDNTY